MSSLSRHTAHITWAGARLTAQPDIASQQSATTVCAEQASSMHPTQLHRHTRYDGAAHESPASRCSAARSFLLFRHSFRAPSQKAVRRLRIRLCLGSTFQLLSR